MKSFIQFHQFEHRACAVAHFCGLLAPLVVGGVGLGHPYAVAGVRYPGYSNRAGNRTRATEIFIVSDPSSEYPVPWDIFETEERLFRTRGAAGSRSSRGGHSGSGRSSGTKTPRVRGGYFSVPARSSCSSRARSFRRV